MDERFDSVYTRANCLPGEWFNAAPSYGEVQLATDRFYEEPANSAIPVVAAIDVVAMKFNGKDGVQIEAKTALLRKVASVSQIH
jgi:hypothetical protein